MEDMRKGLTKLVICGILMMLGTIPVIAGDATDFYNTVYDGTRLIAGDDIHPGYYCLYNNKDNKEASYSIKSGTYILINDTFRYNAIAYLEDGDSLHMTNCYAVPLEEARIIPVEDCMVEVGNHIKPGQYKIEFVRGSSNSATCTVYDTLDFHSNNDKEDKDLAEEKSEVYKVSNGSKAEVELKDGQYVHLSGCKLIDIDEDD